jgi:hypothetical protein
MGDPNCANTNDPACNLTTHTCVECTGDQHCDAGNPYCDTTTTIARNV